MWFGSERTNIYRSRKDWQCNSVLYEFKAPRYWIYTRAELHYYCDSLNYVKFIVVHFVLCTCSANELCLNSDISGSNFEVEFSSKGLWYGLYWSMTVFPFHSVSLFASIWMALMKPVRWLEKWQIRENEIKPCLTLRLPFWGRSLTITSFFL